MSRPHRNAKLICRIDMSAFLGIQIFLLVLFFPLNTIDLPNGASVDYPKASRPVAEPRALREDALIVAVTCDGTVFFDEHKVRIEDLHGKIRDRLIQGAEPKVYIRADARARYRAVADVLYVVRESGVEDIGVLAEERRPQTPAN
jgi:biopolymer transport protein ExbD/biopolymer transport protein TolR